MYPIENNLKFEYLWADLHMKAIALTVRRVCHVHVHVHSLRLRSHRMHNVNCSRYLRAIASVLRAFCCTSNDDFCFVFSCAALCAMYFGYKNFVFVSQSISVRHSMSATHKHTFTTLQWLVITAWCECLSRHRIVAITFAFINSCVFACWLNGNYWMSIRFRFGHTFSNAYALRWPSAVHE